MKTFLIIMERDSYETTKMEVKNLNMVIPRRGERITANSKHYDVINVHYNYDKEEIQITVS